MKKNLLNLLLPLSFIAVIGYYYLVPAIIFAGAVSLIKEFYDYYRFGEDYLENAILDLSLRFAGDNARVYVSCIK